MTIVCIQQQKPLNSKKMKTIKFFTMITALVLVTSSCVENSGKYKAAVAERDSLAQVNMALDSSYNQTLDILNDIEQGFAEINQQESEMKVNLKGVEGAKINKRAVIAAQMTAIKEGIEKNKAKIAELRQLAAKNGKANNVLSATIKRLQAQMDEKDAQIQTLQSELNQKNITINELSTTVSDQSRNIAEQQSVLEQQKNTLKMQETNINTVWYVVATSKELKAAKVISTSGLFQTKKSLTNEFDNSAFTQADLRSVSTIPTNSERIKIMSSHPQSSYNLIKNEDKTITIEITNPSKFWSVSKYLVVQI